MTKKELRKLYLPLRKKITQDIYHKMNENIHKLFFEHFVLSIKTKLRVHTYLSNNAINEIDTWSIIKELEKPQVALVYSSLVKKSLPVLMRTKFNFRPVI